MSACHINTTMRSVRTLFILMPYCPMRSPERNTLFISKYRWKDAMQERETLLLRSNSSVSPSCNKNYSRSATLILTKEQTWCYSSLVIKFS
jgi:hypothetical protein